MNRLEPLTSSSVTVDTPEGLTTIRARIMIGVFDLPAKAAVLCSKQSVGEYGCSVCTHPGQHLSSGARVHLSTMTALTQVLLQLLRLHKDVTLQ